jgi:uncharacterized protein (TIGR02594 family)
MKAPWLVEAQHDLGMKELVAGELNPNVRAMFHHTDFPMDMVNKRTPWCAAAVCAWLERAGVRSPRTARAVNFARYGTAIDLEHALPGDIVVFGKVDPDAGGSGHVALFWQRRGELVDVIGGNQNNRVCIAPRPVVRIVAIRRPTRAAGIDGAP